MLHRYNRKEGFTILELLIVIMIIAITSTIIAPQIFVNVKHVNKIIELKEERELKICAYFLSFIKDEKCKVNKKNVVCNEKEEKCY